MSPLGVTAHDSYDVAMGVAQRQPGTHTCMALRKGRWTDVPSGAIAILSPQTREPGFGHSSA